MKYFAILISIIIFAGCSGFIDLAPQSTATVANVYKTDKDFMDAMVGCYNRLRSEVGAETWRWDLVSDDARHQWATLDNRRNLDEYAYQNNEGFFSSRWNGFYSLIYRANYILEALENADNAVVTNKQTYIGEAKFMRALAHFQLVRAFGDIPLVTRVILDSEALKMGRDPVNKVYEQIIADLIDAANTLPASYTGKDVGRVTRGAAKAILGRVYLTHKKFPEAETVLKEVTAMGYKILDNYNALWDYTKDEHHSEYIFDIEYESNIELGSGLTNEFAPNQADFFKAFGLVGGNGNSYTPSDELFTIFEDHDKRKDVTCARGWIHTETGQYYEIPANAIGAKTFTKKYIAALPRTGDSPANWKVIRYGDVLLMLGEALNENNKTSEALTYVNMIRTRAGVDPYPATISRDDLREEIYQERRRELSFEGHRIWDLFRTGRFLQACAPLGAQPYMVLFPIPLTQIQVMNNREIFPQNPGWD